MSHSVSLGEKPRAAHDSMTIFDLQSYTTVFAYPDRTVIALGCFDGVHIGHRALLRAAVQKASEIGAKAAVWTFSEHPFKRGEVLTELQDKLTLFRECGIQYAFLASYDDVKDVSAPNFVADILINDCHAVCAVCGYNYHFGKYAVGDHVALKKYMSDHGYETCMVDAVCYDGAPVSSTRIRASLAFGKTEEAAAMLGRYYSLSLSVLHGKELGRTLGVPTVNQEIPKSMQSPMRGTYATITAVDGVLYPSVTNVGTRPSILENDDHRINAETHIIGYDGWLYDTSVRVYYCHRLRDEIKFDSLEDLKAQIKRDCAASAQTFDEDKRMIERSMHQ